MPRLSALPRPCYALICPALLSPVLLCSHLESKSLYLKVKQLSFQV